MLPTAALGMLLYGLFSALEGALDLLSAGPLEWWADLWLIFAGATLICGAVLVRASMPGGLALAIAGLLALQSISLHNAEHLYGYVHAFPQIMRLVFAGLLVALACGGWESFDRNRKGKAGPQ